MKREGVQLHSAHLPTLLTTFSVRAYRTDFKFDLVIRQSNWTDVHVRTVIMSPYLEIISHRADLPL